MPHIKVDDIQIYYEIHGTGAQTLTLIRGLGADLSAWFPQIPEFSKHFKTVVFDNRGAGRTDKPDAPYSMRQMADDTNGLLEALDIRRTALLGMSMGGAIAQEFAINYPERLSSLVLVCTSSNAITVGASGEEALFCDETIERRREVIAAYSEARSKFPIPPYSLALQADALNRHDASSRLGQIRTPTLIMTGNEDRLVPPGNSRLLASKISGSILKEFPGGHLFMMEYPDTFNRAVIEFVEGQQL